MGYVTSGAAPVSRKVSVDLSLPELEATMTGLLREPGKEVDEVLGKLVDVRSGLLSEQQNAAMQKYAKPGYG